MVIHPYSPTMFPQTYSTPPYTVSQDTSLRKRKRQYDSEEDLPLHEFIENEHISKKQRDEVAAPLTPTSPPSSVTSIQRFSSPPSSEQDTHFLYDDKNVITHPSYMTQRSTNSHPSDVENPIPSQNLLLRDLHMNSRAYQINQDRSMDKDEEMWQEEEEIVAERYSAMNKLLGSRRPIW